MRKQGLSFRDFKVAVLHCEINDRRTLLRHFARLGVEAAYHEDVPLAKALAGVEAIFFDGDASLPSSKLPEMSKSPEMFWTDVPLIALVGSEAPSRLEWILSLNISAFLIKPVRSVGVLTALAVASREFQLRKALRARIERLEERLQGRRFVVSAQLALMRDHGLSEADAFARLRRLAMEGRTTIEAISIGITARSTDGGARRALG
ncbi:Two-component response regulator, AmiR/NasT family, consists of REC and RNA-binding antiterminator (ANTAR) domains [Rhizobiales bacterium GAS191]|jgi:AmiR/NasT family two-component response regulator|nr:Two-component response regulator, AmiR/NasT family, consists of REC and RNA-binding antiterminator (ANTAR) domains [Rhizobiales bacterium GAS113]SEE56446.1 Two-component response regulator, AmiR/NasT family, consists of REC and RNA-binding antiterminator (ANTAR) domains [Rhizobiales bacterium GAS191]